MREDREVGGGGGEKNGERGKVEMEDRKERYSPPTVSVSMNT